MVCGHVLRRVFLGMQLAVAHAASMEMEGQAALCDKLRAEVLLTPPTRCIPPFFLSLSTVVRGRRALPHALSDLCAYYASI